MSIRDRIAAARDIETTTVDVPEWGVKLELRSPTGYERADLLSQNVDEDGTTRTNWHTLWPMALVACAYDPETGERAFTYDDVDMLNSKNGVVLTRIGDKCLEVAGLRDKAVDEAASFPVEAS